MADPEKNVLTGDAFGEDSDAGGFGTESLFTVDEKAMQQAFKFDTKALEQGMAEAMSADSGSLELSDMIDPADLQLEMPEFPQPDKKTYLNTWILPLLRTI